MRRVIVKMPNPLGTRHHVEVIGFVSVRDHDRMVSSRNQHDVAILHRHGLTFLTFSRELVHRWSCRPARTPHVHFGRVTPSLAPRELLILLLCSLHWK